MMPVTVDHFIKLVRRRGFIPQKIDNPEGWITDQTDKGRLVMRWEGSVAQVDEFAKGVFDALIYANYYVPFPRHAKSIYYAMRHQSGIDIRMDDLKGCPFSLNALGKLKTNLSDIAVAANAFQMANEILPDFAEPYNNLGSLLWARGQKRDACHLFAEALVKDPENPFIQANFLDAVYDLKDYHVLIDVIEKIRRDNPGYHTLDLHYVLCLNFQGEEDRAVRVLKDYIKLFPDDGEAGRLLEYFHTGCEVSYHVSH